MFSLIRFRSILSIIIRAVRAPDLACVLDGRTMDRSGAG